VFMRLLYPMNLFDLSKEERWYNTDQEGNICKFVLKEKIYIYIFFQNKSITNDIEPLKNFERVY
jgi:hypothetical protein